MELKTLGDLVMADQLCLNEEELLDWVNSLSFA